MLNDNVTKTESTFDFVTFKSSKQLSIQLGKNDRYCPKCGDTKWIMNKEILPKLPPLQEKGDGEIVRLFCCTFCNTRWTVRYEVHTTTRIHEPTKENGDDTSDWDDGQLPVVKAQAETRQLEEEIKTIQGAKKEFGQTIRSLIKMYVQN